MLKMVDSLFFMGAGAGAGGKNRSRKKWTVSAALVVKEQWADSQRQRLSLFVICGSKIALIARGRFRSVRIAIACPPLHNLRHKNVCKCCFTCFESITGTQIRNRPFVSTEIVFKNLKKVRDWCMKIGLVNIYKKLSTSRL